MNEWIKLLKNFAYKKCITEFQEYRGRELFDHPSYILDAFFSQIDIVSQKLLIFFWPPEKKYIVGSSEMVIMLWVPTTYVFKEK